MNVSKFTTLCTVMLLFLAWAPETAHSQFLQTWLDIGEMQSQYSEIGYRQETQNSIMWPAIVRQSGHHRGQAHWIGIKNWTDERGNTFEYHVARLGPRPDGSVFFTPVETRLISRWEDTEVFVDGAASFSNIAIVDEVDPNIPADRMLYHKYRSVQGMEMERWVYAYSNEVHDEYHLIVRTYANTGNTDADDEIELDGQTLNDVYIWNNHRWRGRQQAADHGSRAQTWGKYSMVDIVGDGHDTYPVDFTATYLWKGYDPVFASTNWDPLGSPLIQSRSSNAPSDTFGRLAGMSMQGRIVLHIDESTTDETYNPANQPSTLGWMDSDEVLTADGASNRDYYELGIRTRENPDLVPGGSSRMFPHYADRVEPSREFWNPTQDASTGKQGGHASTIAYGPYQMAFGEDVRIVEAEVVGGISYEAATDIGRAWKLGGLQRDQLIDFDANGDGVINDTPWDYDIYLNGSERLTKNQWVLTARDSMFKNMYRARDVWEASNNMTQYPIVSPPAPPRTFELFGRPDQVELSWTSMSGEADPVSWEVYRTRDFEDNLPYELIATLPGSARNYDDANLQRGIDYYYYLQAVGPPNSVDPLGLTGTPGGLPLRSGRYYTQSYAPVNLKRPPGASADAFRIVPNPVNLGADDTVRFFVGGDATRSQVAFFDIPGECTITIYTETGEFVTRIEHTDGSGDEIFNLLTEGRQPFVSGIYLVRVEDNNSGDTDVKKMVVIQ